MILAEAYDGFLVDLDGVIWRGEASIDGASETIATLRQQGKRIVFVTNNSSRTPREYAAKLMRHKVPTETGDIVTSGHAVVEALRELDLEEGDRVHVFGAEGLIRLIAGERWVPTEETDDVRAVVVGWTRQVDYDRIHKASSLARAGVPFIASNADATYPAADASYPGAGAILAAVETAAGREAHVVGKPNPPLFRLALERCGTEAERTLFVGDRPETDVAGARNAGIPSALVLTGVTGEGQLGSAEPVPDEILDSLSDLLTDQPRVSVEDRDGILVARDDGDLAWVDRTRKGQRVTVNEVGVPAHVESRTAWRAVRRLLVEALAGAEEVDASDDVRPLLERLGIGFDGPSQARLFTR